MERLEDFTGSMPCFIEAAIRAFEVHEADLDLTNKKFKYYYDLFHLVKRTGNFYLKDADKFIKKYFPDSVACRFYKDARKKIRNIPDVTGSWIFLVKDHYIYAQGKYYFSAFDNNEDKIIAGWCLEKGK